MYEGYGLFHAIERISVNGETIKEHLKDLLFKKGVVVALYKKDVITDIKEKFCYLSQNDFKEVQEVNNKKKVYTFPDDKMIKHGSELYEAPEILFFTNLCGIDSLGVQEMITKVIKNCPIDTRSAYLNQIKICGGTTFITGFSKGLSKEIQKQFEAYVLQRRIDILNYRKLHSVFNGGALMANCRKFKDIWFTRETYLEEGVKEIHDYYFT